MLRRWVLENFKPINGVADLKLNSITLFAGLNSSGKSSVLQSILLVSQTLSNPNPDKPLILNGPIVQLGTFEGTLNERAAGKSLRLGFELCPSPARSHRLGGAGHRGRSIMFPEHQLSAIRTSVSFSAAAQLSGAASGIDAVKVCLSEATIEVDVIDEPGAPERRVSARVMPLSEEDEQAFLSDVVEAYFQFVPYHAGSNYVSELVDTLSVRRMLTRLLHFLPHRLLRKFNVRDRRQEELMSLIEFVFEGRAAGSERSHLHPRIIQILTHEPSQAFRKRLETIAAHEATEPVSGRTIADVLDWVRDLQEQRGTSPGFVSSVKEAVISEFVAEKGGRPHGGAEYGLDSFSRSPVLTASEYTTDYFTTMIRYLGPLRADPQAAQGFAPSSEPDDVGFKGEYAASVFDANKHQDVTWWDPFAWAEKRGSLERAMDVWLRYLGVGHHVLTREAGLSGVLWCLQQTPGSGERPLHAVGIGVSQVLPILVAGLMAPQGAMFLIEQPELHLHERAQARLGDFFFGLAQIGKQCIIETHSVCLVNQIRYHIVKGGQAARDMTTIYFVEQDEHGDAHFSEVEVSPHGNIGNWPDGFFDQGALQEDLITRESIRARANRASRDGQGSREE